MKNETSANLNCVYNTISLIEKNYDQVISIEELEEVSHYSYRNIQRIFKYTCGETVGAYQKRLRVENAYKMMLYTSDNISVIALKVGFANLASFSKAFKQHFGIAPTEAKLQKSPLLAKAEIFPVEASAVLKPEIVYLRPVTVYYGTAFISYVDEEVEALWDKFMQNEFPEYGNEFYGIIADEPLIRENLKCRYDTCSSMQAKHTRLPAKTIGGGKYAQFTHLGAYETIEETYTKIYSGWILGTVLEFGPAPVIEKYIKHPGNTSSAAEQLTYIYLPLS
ncbi:AraC family transcriptional regulator [Pedobacter steynii]|uniref:AraC family transcriptional regulator n=1 Tax=Pedobacter steynii TaxID=430522 RepID=A0A1G9UAA5_9SPHI|nr:AraC family transcriptional regulator [Pedobacter steynii]NQX40706.1 AraC family transcriptional regulator [Pedobacter steynii]SDM56654.1 AraC family transcriptional regulator [Pedobacter steynii]